MIKGSFKESQQYIGVVGAVIIFFVLGSNYSIPNYAPYLSSYFHHLNGRQGQFYTSILMTLQSIFYSLGQLTSLYIDKYFQGKILLILFIELMLYCIGIFLGSQFKNVIIIVTFQVFSYGFVYGVVYYSILLQMWRNFPEQKPKVTGIILLAIAVAPSFYNYVTHSIVNPDDLPANETVFEKDLEIKYFSEEVYNRVPTMFIYHSLIDLAFFTLGYGLIWYFYYIQKKSQNSLIEGQSQNSIRNYLIQSNQQPEIYETLQQSTQNRSQVKQALKSLKFWQLFVIKILMGITFSFVIRNYKFYGLVLRSDKDYFLTGIEGLASIIQGFSRLIWGIIAQKYTAYTCLKFIYFGQNIYVFGSVLVFMFSIYGGGIVCSLVFALQTFDKDISTQIIPLLNLSGILVSNIVILVERFSITNLGYKYNFLLLSCSSFIAFLLLLLYKNKIAYTDSINQKSENNK